MINDLNSKIAMLESEVARLLHAEVSGTYLCYYNVWRANSYARDQVCLRCEIEIDDGC